MKLKKSILVGITALTFGMGFSAINFQLKQLSKQVPIERGSFAEFVCTTGFGEIRLLQVDLVKASIYTHERSFTLLPSITWVKMATCYTLMVMARSFTMLAQIVVAGLNIK